jgi:hypothetical protein
VTPSTITAMNGLGTIRFVARIKAGRGEREVPIDVDPGTIVALARALEATRWGACDNENRKFVDATRDGYIVGHALWHLENPERVMPCIDPSRVIDMRSLTAGDEGATVDGMKEGK